MATTTASQQPATTAAGLRQAPADIGQGLPSTGQSLPISGQPGRAGMQAVGPIGTGAAGQGRAVGPYNKAPVGDETWQLASDVMAAGVTATTVSAVTTAAQQVRAFADISVSGTGSHSLCLPLLGQHKHNFRHKIKICRKGALLTANPQ